MFVVSSHAPKAPKLVRSVEDHGQIGIAAGDPQSRGQAGIEAQHDDESDGDVLGTVPGMNVIANIAPY